MRKNISLSVDNSFAKGSVSIWSQETQLDFRLGKENLSKTLLITINDLLTKNNVSLNNIKEIVYTNGPGSFTSLRVGIATLFALKKALRVPIFPVNALEAMTSKVSFVGNYYIYLELKKKRFACQNFIVDGSNGEINFYDETQMGKILSDTTKIAYCISKSSNSSDLSNTHKKEIRDIKTSASDNVSKCSYQFYNENRVSIGKKINTFPIY